MILIPVYYYTSMLSHAALRGHCILSLFLLSLLLFMASAQKCLTIHNCNKCDTRGCTECALGFRLDRERLCVSINRPYSILVIVACVLLAVMSIFASGWIVYGYVLRCRRRRMLEVVRMEMANQQGSNRHLEIDFQGNTHRVMLPSAPSQAFLSTEVCTICLEGNIQIRSSCEHYFHLLCILEWHTKRRSCPNCRELAPLFMILCRKCHQFNEQVHLCNVSCRSRQHEECF